ncbi:hypothetical protein LR48_Vigan08g096400 [Vigna angularis]|uniref:Uncharacterized protein n=1 Tax=Phaseolus angularis TaxID=3914 RepID=A0A0L9V5B3_PHAAN|nr:hypothetical protein LR48_Vigan08g096400 [Vigna angularis]
MVNQSDLGKALQGINTKAAPALSGRGGLQLRCTKWTSWLTCAPVPSDRGAPAPAEQPEARFGSTVHVTQHVSRDPADLAFKLVFYFEFWREFSSELRPFFTYK